MGEEGASYNCAGCPGLGTPYLSTAHDLGVQPGTAALFR